MDTDLAKKVMELVGNGIGNGEININSKAKDWDNGWNVVDGNKMYR